MERSGSPTHTHIHKHILTISAINNVTGAHNSSAHRAREGNTCLTVLKSIIAHRNHSFSHSNQRAVNFCQQEQMGMCFVQFHVFMPVRVCGSVALLSIIKMSDK